LEHKRLNEVGHFGNSIMSHDCTSIHRENSLSVLRRLPQFTVEKNVLELEFLNDLKFILYLKYDNFSTTWCMTRLPLLPITLELII
jgi:hypothetical protein